MPSIMKRCMKIYNTTMGSAVMRMTADNSCHLAEYCPWKKYSPVASGLCDGDERYIKGVKKSFQKPIKRIVNIVATIGFKRGNATTKI